MPSNVRTSSMFVCTRVRGQWREERGAKRRMIAGARIQLHVYSLMDIQPPTP